MLTLILNQSVLGPQRWAHRAILIILNLSPHNFSQKCVQYIIKQIFFLIHVISPTGILKISSCIYDKENIKRVIITFCLVVHLVYILPLWNMSNELRLTPRVAYQVHNLVVPSTGYKDYFPCFLNDFELMLKFSTVWVHWLVLQLWRCHIKNKLAKPVL